MIKAILMDFNGVIINDEPVQMAAYQEVLGKEGIELTEANYYGSLGMDDRTFTRASYERASKACDEVKVSEITAAKTAAWKAAISRGMPLFEGVEDFIAKSAQEFALGLVSMAKREEIEHVLIETGLHKYFSVLVTAEDVSNCKPDPECFRIGFEKLDAHRTAGGHYPITHNECLVIEDSPPGVKAAKAADLRALGVTNTVDAAALRAAGAEAIAKDLRDWFPESIRLVFN
ncbi:MAG: HAD family hydrolase [Pyrinomonadaceae bacterium]